MTRFFVEPEEMQAENLTLTGENAQHAKVLRLKAGEEVLVCDGAGQECLCRVVDFDAGEVALEVLERSAEHHRVTDSKYAHGRKQIQKAGISPLLF